MCRCIALINTRDSPVLCEVLLKQGWISWGIAAIDLADPFQFSQIRAPIARQSVAWVRSQPVDSVMHVVPEAHREVIPPLNVKRAIRRKPCIHKPQDTTQLLNVRHCLVPRTECRPGNYVYCPWDIP